MSENKIIRLNPNPEGFGETPDELEAEDFATALPRQHTHSYYENDELGLFIGVWDTDDMKEAAGPYGTDEFMWVLEGASSIKNMKTGELETAKAGEAFAVPRGYDCQWQQTGYMRKYYVLSENPNETIPDKPSLEGIAIPRADAAVNAMTGGEPFTIKGDAVQKSHDCYVDTTGKFLTGTWECENFESESRSFPYYEFAYVQEGSITLTDENGEAHVFNTGDAFFIPKGVVCSGYSNERVRLFYSVLRTA